MLLEDRHLARLFRYEQQAREERRRRVAGGAGEDQVDRLLDRRAARHVDEDAVAMQRGVQADEGVLLELGVLAEVGVDELRVALPSVRQRADDGAFRQALEVRQLGRQAAVDDDQLGAVGVDVALDVGRGDRAGARVEGELGLGDGRHVGEAPLLVAGGGEAELGEAADRGVAQRRQARRAGRRELVADGGEGGRVALHRAGARDVLAGRAAAFFGSRGDGHRVLLGLKRSRQPGQQPVRSAPRGARSPFLRARAASSLPPVCTILPSTMTWTTSGTMYSRSR